MMSFSYSPTIENLTKVIQGQMPLQDLAQALTLNGPQEVDQLLHYHGVTALSRYQSSLLGPNNIHSSTSVTPAPAAPNQDQAKDDLRLVVANESLRSSELKRILNYLDQEGLSSFLLFKGTALAYAVYDQPWLRPRTDTDILIDESDLDKFTGAFTQLGYRKEFAIDGNLISYQCTFSKTLVGQANLYIDLHWRISNRQCLAGLFTAKELLERALPLSKLHDYALYPNHVDCLVLACQHRLGHHHTEERLIWLCDIHLLASALNNQQWNEFIQIVRQKRLSNICLDGIQSAQHYLGTEVPHKVIEQLKTLTQHTEPSAVFLNRGLSNRQILMSDLKSIPSISEKMKFVIQTAFPPPSYIRQQMKTRYASWGYLKRAWQGLKKL